MAWTDDVFDRAHAHNTDLANIEANFALLKSLFMAAGAPASMAAGHPWLDSTKHVLKYRNDGDSAWVGLMHGDTSQKIWVYRNAAPDGWAVDSSVSDKVLGLKGGSTYTTGAATAGTWTISGLSAANESAHTHSHTHTGTTDNEFANLTAAGGTDVTASTHTHTFTTGANAAAGSAHTHVISHDGTTRIAAAVGTLQYLDL